MASPALLVFYDQNGAAEHSPESLQIRDSTMFPLSLQNGEAPTSIIQHPVRFSCLTSLEGQRGDCVH